jgi:hypothetical protein
VASITELLDGVRDQLSSDPLVSAAVSSVISPEGRTLLASFVSGLADLEAKHEAAKQAAVEAAKAPEAA